MRLIHEGPIPSGAKARESPLIEELLQVALRHGVQLVGLAYPTGEAGDIRTLVIDGRDGDYSPVEVANLLRATGVDLIEISVDVRRLPLREGP